MNAYFLSDDPYHLAQEGSNGWMDGQTDKNFRTIAVTLRLCFAVRVKSKMYIIRLQYCSLKALQGGCPYCQFGLGQKLYRYM